MSADTRLVEHPTEPAIWHFYKGGRMRGLISQLPTDEYYYCVDGKEREGYFYFTLEETEKYLRASVEFVDLETEMTATGEPVRNSRHEWKYGVLVVGLVLASAFVFLTLLSLAMYGVLSIIGWLS